MLALRGTLYSVVSCRPRGREGTAAARAGVAFFLSCDSLFGGPLFLMMVFLNAAPKLYNLTSDASKQGLSAVYSPHVDVTCEELKTTSLGAF